MALTLPSIPDIEREIGVFHAFELPQATGASGAVTYSLAPLPSGLSFDASTLRVAGTTTKTADVIALYSATDSAETTTATVRFSIIPVRAQAPAGPDEGVLANFSASVGALASASADVESAQRNLATAQEELDIAKAAAARAVSAMETDLAAYKEALA